VSHDDWIHPHQPLRVFLSLAGEKMEVRVVLELQRSGYLEFVIKAD
jgi:hypothetical protein